MAQGCGYGHWRQGNWRGVLEYVPGESISTADRSPIGGYVVAGRWGKLEWESPSGADGETRRAKRIRQQIAGRLVAASISEDE